MKRLYEAAAYGPQKGCFWADTVQPAHWPTLDRDIQTDVAIIGGGFTGLSAALHLAQDNVRVTVIEAETPGWGASGRNGGFCCLGGAKAPRRLLQKRFGTDGLAEWCATEKAAIDTVATLLDAHGIDADTHSDGETIVAHTPSAMANLRASMDEIRTDFGVTPHLTEASDLPHEGLSGPFHGALTIPLGFALNPRKYHGGLAQAAQTAGATLHARTPVTRLTQQDGKTRLTTPGGTVTADRVILATNGYSSEDVPDWLRARYLPVQSSVIVTRPLTLPEQLAQGWTSAQMAYDTRTLLHYFRKLPDNRFLFGMRGGLRATPRAETAIRRKIRADFHAMFPAWKDVEITHDWSGLVCLMANLTPFAGPVPELPGVFAGLGYHGNGVAMGSHTGRLLAAIVQGKTPDAPYPQAMRQPATRFPLGRFRRALLAPAYAAASLLDR
ncbi:NAD(P)/FAD-dependent oxidoreductase [Puniceibacterium sediminis]|uniref:Glycine/D-amino acid oxidase n=1 Tax=Puniceibacterium sediminis TaxID=1608407 RepID=A0A238VHU6_9RHOB|nr:FAD-binding oxidoreductase [Puniceibacterium sediminis]SNR33970.1 Glycine/D-amino acid oxidase [Puniceibacterium sediminis]